MKKLYLVYNPPLENYIFYESEKMRNRTEFTGNNLIDKVVQQINPKRKAILYLKDIPNNIDSKLRKRLKKSKIEIKIQL